MTPYKQAFIVAMESGAVALVVVMGRNKTEADASALAAVKSRLAGKAWDMCAYPVTGDLPEGVTVLREARP